METTFGAVMGAVLGLAVAERRASASRRAGCQPVAQLAGRAAGGRDADGLVEFGKIH